MITAEGVSAERLCLYLVSAEKLAYTLKKYLAIDMIMMVIDTKNSITQDQRGSLVGSGWLLCDVPQIDPIMNKENMVMNPYLSVKMFSKLQLWRLTEYDAILYVDSDVLTLRSPLQIFTKFIPRMRRAGLYLSMVQTGYRWNDFNAGVMVVIPSGMTVERMCESINTTSFNENLAEQNFLNAFWKNRIMHLPRRYNTYSDDVGDCAQTVFLHFIRKPWQGPIKHSGREGIRQFWLHSPPSRTCV